MSSFRSSGAGPVSYVMARQGGVLLPLTPPRRKERPKVSATGAHDSSSCVLKCSLDKSTLTPSASRGPASQGAAWTKELETHDGQASNPHGRTSHARTCKQNLSCLATVVRAGKLETVPALPSTTRRHPQLIPVTSEGVGWGVFFPGLAARRPGFLRDGETGGRTPPPDPSRRKERPKVSATGAHDSSSCVLKCSLDKSRPASPAAYAFGFTRACEPGGGVDQRT